MELFGIQFQFIPLS